MKLYAKAIAAFFGALSTWGVAAGADDAYSQVELWGLLGVLGTAAVVAFVPNGEGDPEEPNDVE